MSTTVKLFVFDLDGTLIDTMGAFADIAGRLIRDNYGWTFEAGRKRYLETSGVPFAQQLDILFPNEPRNPTIAATFEDRKVEPFLKERTSESTRETLHALRDREIRTAISSNNSHDLVLAFVHREKVPVDLALGFKRGFGKGAAHFEHLRNYFGVSSEEMVFVGDSLTDAVRARENHVTFVGRLGTFTAEDFRDNASSSGSPVIYEISELLDILEDL